ncbi:LOW QUALITY PROTEIN: interferon-gamma-inducible GTPase 10-like [Stegostoma tigrinum]|uniref:LOW QUALITY PROTEIN: interferon-gamma-inducible GTPase 10-like n=1 Tax=Stegostoma tigrinum TaxID=3053191 RepID=UPI0028703BCB|nr:LOW QUALITY PROTEIN: interferon-gamma-inducible GTPase 10-like [Stegostoma tigrinum]
MGGSSSRDQMDQSSNYSYFSLAEINEMKNTFVKHGVTKVIPLIQKRLYELDNTELNVAVTGDSGAGKSTFINAMRGLQRNDEGAAETGTTETTMKPIGYKHPNLPHVCFWDLPGIGTVKFPASKYLKAMNFKIYDFFIIIIACRFTENDVILAKEIKQLGKKFYFIRSKIDNDLHSERTGGGRFNEVNTLEKIRKDCVSKLQEAGIPSPSVFLMSSLNLDQYDFNLLNKALEGDLPNIKKSVHVLALPNLNSKIVEKKREELRRQIWMVAIVCGAFGAFSAPGQFFDCDIPILINTIKKFHECLGLDNASLQRLANIAGKPVEKLKAVVSTRLVGSDIIPYIIRIRERLSVNSISAVEMTFATIPVASIFAARSSYLAAYKLLNAALDDLTENAQRVITAAVETESIRDQEAEASNCLENQTVESSNSSFFTEEELNKLKSDYETGGVEKAKTVLQQKATELDKTELNVAVTGKTGAGKSSFINAMRGLQFNDEGAAEVSSVMCTMEPTRYKHPNLPNVCFWDLPGIGTIRFPVNEYLKEMKFKKYDFFIIISDSRFTENDVILAKEIKRLGKNFYFVHSKIDMDLAAMRRGMRVNEEEELVKIRNNYVSKLQEAGIPSPRVFLISNFELDWYDFRLLDKALEDDLPHIKKSVPTYALPNLNLDIAEKKRKELKKQSGCWRRFLVKSGQCQFLESPLLVT